LKGLGPRGTLVTSRLTSVTSLATFGTSPMAKPRTLHPASARLANPAVRRKMLEVLGRQLSESDADDVVQATFLALCLLIDELPPTDDALLGLVVVITRHKLVDFFRHRLVHDGRREEVEEIDELSVETHAPSPETRADWNKMLALVEAQIAAGNVPPEALRWAGMLAKGMTVAEIAKADGVSESRVKMVLVRAREVLGPHWKALGGGAIGVILIILGAIYIPRPEPAPTALPDNTEMGRTRATSSAAASTTPPPHESPTMLRDLARDECAALDYSTCAMDLDRAKELDPDGEKLPEVIAMRKVLHDVMNDQRKKP